MERTTDKPGGRRYKKAPHNSVKAYTTAELKQRFLEEYINYANIMETCNAVGMIRRTFYQWLEGDEEFGAKFKKAEKMALGVLEDEAHRRAVTGVDKPVYQGGVLVGHVKEYSDPLLILLLKARAPHKYKDRFAGELTGANGQPLLEHLKIQHVHSVIPLATAEEHIIQNKEAEQLMSPSFKLPESESEEIGDSDPNDNLKLFDDELSSL